MKWLVHEPLSEHAEAFVGYFLDENVNRTNFPF